MDDKWDSLYCYEGTDVLRNRFGTRDQKELDQREADFVGVRLMELYYRHIYGSFDIQHLMAIHRYLFQDVYDWAGELRKCDIKKDYTEIAPEIGVWPFGHHRKAPLFLNEQILCGELKSEGYLKGCKNKRSLAKRLSYFMSEINAAHPFREGNGRTQREFIRCLAMRAGYELDWTLQPAEELTKARALSLKKTDYLTDLVEACIVNDSPDTSISREYRQKSRKNKRRNRT